MAEAKKGSGGGKTEAQKKAAADAKRARREARKQAAESHAMHPHLAPGAERDVVEPPAEGADALDPYAHLGSNAPTGDEE